MDTLDKFGLNNGGTFVKIKVHHLEMKLTFIWLLYTSCKFILDLVESKLEFATE